MASTVAKRLEGKTIVVTGASSGIGCSTAIEFAKASPTNLKLVLTARRLQNLEELATRIKDEVGNGVKVHPVKMDVSDPQDVKDFVGNLPAEFKEIDVLVNNAGLVKGVAKAPEILDEDINVMFSTNVTGLISLTQAVLPIFLKRPDGGRGDIINIGSIAGRDGYAGGSIYCATKAAVRTFTDALRKELVATRIRIMEVDPGQVETEFSVVRFGGDKAKADAVYAGVEPLTPEDIAEVVVFAAGRRENVVIADTLIFPSHQTVDTNSAYFAKFCFSLGINVKRIEVIPDDEDDIIEAVRRLSSSVDFVALSGGIGPTHDDITYASVAKAFGLRLKLNDDALARMKELSRPHPSQPDFSWDTPSTALTAKLRMIQLPHDASRAENDQVLFVDDRLWVPVNVVNGNVFILPGIPRLFQQLLDGLKPFILPRVTDPEGEGLHRILISTPLAESAVAGYLTELAAKVESKGVKVGSYPRWGRSHNTVTLVGRDAKFMESLVAEVEQGVDGARVTEEDEKDRASEVES
ncbi:MAG: hypothetical protein M1838_003139 [Thelocarpon superellum]|nr:MAG: hypothetical protein M1838_003139 [Thelocarpon superellum]